MLGESHGGGEYRESRTEIEAAARAVLDELGPGWAEFVYQSAMEVELRLRGMTFERQRNVPVRYKGIYVATCIPDLVIHLGDELLVVELKATEYLRQGDAAQLKRQVRELSSGGVRVEGMLINFSNPGPKRKLADAEESDLQIVTYDA